jgi:hypothetical protein
MSDAANPGYQNVMIKLLLTAKLLAMLSCFAAGAPARGREELGNLIAPILVMSLRRD